MAIHVRRISDAEPVVVVGTVRPRFVPGGADSIEQAAPDDYPALQFLAVSLASGNRLTALFGGSRDLGMWQTEE